MKQKKMKLSQWIVFPIAAIAAVVPLFISNTYIINLLVLTTIYCVLASAWNFISGFAGQFGFSGVFFALGAYVTAGMFDTLKISPWIGMFIAAVVVSVVALGMGYLTFSLRKTYFTLATLALLNILQLIFVQNKVILGIDFKGTAGLRLPWIGGLVNMQFMSNRGYYYIALAILIITLIITNILVRSKMGFYFKAINTNPMAASSLGVNVMKYKQFAQIMTAFIMGLIGGVYVMYISSIEPISMFSYEIVFNIMLMALVGGRATVYGPTIGAIILMPLYALLRLWFSSTLPGLPTAIFGLILLLVTQFMPEGLVPFVQEKLHLRKQRLASQAETAQAK
ncbi:MAG TPA: branched-chain amino acid ABC transporter permease [Candidatus Cryosericum sp.]|nr:branched-chain amino acid ABC transporter permease [Candidatus Cryosericum sp.]